MRIDTGLHQFSTSAPLPRPRIYSLGCCVLLGMLLGTGLKAQSVVDREISRRHELVTQAEDLVKQGDGLYGAHKFGEAYDKYNQALAKLPQAPVTETLRQDMQQRLSLAAMMHASRLAREGNLPEAKKLLQQSLQLNPGNADAEKLLAKLDDDVAYNPALDVQHVDNVKQVNKLLLLGYGHLQLGEFDKAQSQFEKVLRIDAHNVAARRAMERLNKLKNDYANAAYDATRSEMLMQVAKAWEQELGAEVAGVDANTRGTALKEPQGGYQQLLLKIVERVNFDNVSPEEALDFIAAQSRRLDPLGKGINVFLGARSGSDEYKRIQAERLSMQLQQVPLEELLGYVAQSLKCRVVETPFAVKLVPLSQDDGSMQNRAFSVPASFFASQQGSSAAAAPSNDPFGAPAAANSGLQISKSNPVEALKASGVEFPAGSSASYNPSSNSLYVKNTAANLDMIEQIVEAYNSKSPIQVVIETTVIETTQENLRELGFEWAVGIGGLGSVGSALVGGNPVTAGLFPTLIGGGQPPVVTSGLRTGEQALPSDSIDKRIREAFDSVPNTTPRPAPGIISARAIMTDADVLVMMRGLNQKKGTDNLQRASLIARPGEKASLFNIRELMYPTEYEPPQIPQNVGGGNGDDNNNNVNGNNNNQGANPFAPLTPSHPTSFEKRDVGWIFEVEPNVSEDRNYVDLKLNPSQTDFDGFVNYGSPIFFPYIDRLGNPQLFERTANQVLMPVFSTKRMNTSVTLANNHTLVVGGLLKSRVRTYEDKVPILGDVPGVGRLFSSEGREVVNKAIIILCKVRVVDPSGRDATNSVLQSAQP